MGSGSLWVVVPHAGSAVFNKKEINYWKERFVAWKVRTKVGEILNSFKPSKLCPPLFKRHSKELNIPADHRLPGKIWKTDKLTRSFILVSYSN